MSETATAESWIKEKQLSHPNLLKFTFARLIIFTDSLVSLVCSAQSFRDRPLNIASNDVILKWNNS